MGGELFAYLQVRGWVGLSLINSSCVLCVCHAVCVAVGQQLNDPVKTSVSNPASFQHHDKQPRKPPRPDPPRRAVRGARPVLRRERGAGARGPPQPPPGVPGPQARESADWGGRVLKGELRGGCFELEWLRQNNETADPPLTQATHPPTQPTNQPITQPTTQPTPDGRLWLCQKGAPWDAHQHAVRHARVPGARDHHPGGALAGGSPLSW
jgi:hypothetical protein